MSLILLQDCREKHGHHSLVENYCREHNITIVRKRLNVGDYMFPNGKVSVDTKQDLAELANDLYRDKLAFNKKYKKCLKDGIKLIVLVEQEVKSLRELVSWKSPYTKITGRELLDMIDTVRLSYGVDFLFCAKETTGENLIRLLKGEK